MKIIPRQESLRDRLHREFELLDDLLLEIKSKSSHFPRAEFWRIYPISVRIASENLAKASTSKEVGWKDEKEQKLFVLRLQQHQRRIKILNFILGWSTRRLLTAI